MDGYLVMLCHTMDDLPLGLFQAEHQAREYAKKVKRGDDKLCKSVMNSDASTPLCVKLVTFREGKPKVCEVVQEF